MGNVPHRLSHLTLGSWVVALFGNAVELRGSEEGRGWGGSASATSSPALGTHLEVLSIAQAVVSSLLP